MESENDRQLSRFADEPARQGKLSNCEFHWFYVPWIRRTGSGAHAVNEYLRWVYASGQDIAQAQGYPRCRRRFCKRCARKWPRCAKLR